MMRITVIGVGNVGVVIAYGALLKFGCHIDLIDIDKMRLNSEVADLQQANEVLHLKSKIEAVEHPRESDFYIITASKNKVASGDRDALFKENSIIIDNYMSQIAKVRKDDSIVIMVSNPSGRLAQIALNHVPIVISAGNKLDNARLRLSRVTGLHERPNIQDKRDDVFSGKGYTSLGIAAEVLSYMEAIWINTL